MCSSLVISNNTEVFKKGEAHIRTWRDHMSESHKGFLGEFSFLYLKREIYIIFFFQFFFLKIE